MILDLDFFYTSFPLPPPPCQVIEYSERVPSCLFVIVLFADGMLERKGYPQGSSVMFDTVLVI